MHQRVLNGFQHHPSKVGSSWCQYNLITLSVPFVQHAGTSLDERHVRVTHPCWHHTYAWVKTTHSGLHVVGWLPSSWGDSSGESSGYRRNRDLCACACVYTCIQACVCVCVCACACVCVYVYMRMCVCVCACACVYAYVCMWMCVTAHK